MESWFLLSFFRLIRFWNCGPGADAEPSGEESPPPDSDPFSDAEFGKISPTSQDNSQQGRIANSSSTNAVRVSSARTTKRFPSP
jgi:hypothetical protein